MTDLCGPLVPWFVLLSASIALAAEQGVPLHDGDIIFHTSRSSQSVAVQHATKSPYSHMGIVLRREGKPFVFEAAATVTFTPLDEWIARGIGGHYVVKRLADPSRLTEPALQKLTREARTLSGKPYDFTFGWTDERIYCSELVWKLYQRALGIELGRLQRLRDFDLRDSIVAAKLHERYGDRVPLDERVISPVAIFDSDKLVTIARQ